MPLIIIFIITTCKISNQEGYTAVNRGMYFWKNEPDLGKPDFKRLDSLGIEKFYMKVFEVEPDPVHKAVPTSEADFEWDSKILEFISGTGEIVPVIYIENETFSSMDSSEMGWLARKVKQKIDHIIHGVPMNEIQIDCDWTATTKDRYFRFIRKLKRFSDRTISVTLRLHQIKDQELTGIPPADRGVLMYYNMGRLTDYEECNSLLNNEVGRNYIQKVQEYHMPMDFALPAFSWGILFRYKEFKGIINDFHPGYLPESIMQRNNGTNWFVIKKDSSVKNKYFRYNDEIRYERVTRKKLLEAIDILKRIKTPNDTAGVIFYNWNEAKTYDQQILDSVYSSF